MGYGPSHQLRRVGYGHSHLAYNLGTWDTVIPTMPYNTNIASAYAVRVMVQQHKLRSSSSRSMSNRWRYSGWSYHKSGHRNSLPQNASIMVGHFLLSILSSMIKEHSINGTSEGRCIMQSTPLNLVGHPSTVLMTLQSWHVINGH